MTAADVQTPDKVPEGVRVGRIAEAFTLRHGDREPRLECARCGHDYGPAERDPKLGAVMREGAIEELSPLNRFGLVDRFVVRFFYCPDCALLVAVDVQEHGDPIMVETHLTLSRV